MSGFSNVSVMGNIVRDPNLKYTNNGKAVSRIRLAINKNSKTRSSDNRDDKSPVNIEDNTVFLDVQLWGRTAEFVVEYFGRGKPIIVHGQLAQENYTDRDGIDRNQILLIGHRVNFPHTDKDESALHARSDDPPPSKDLPKAATRPQPPARKTEEPARSGYEDEDDIPPSHRRRREEATQPTAKPANTVSDSPPEDDDEVPF